MPSTPKTKVDLSGCTPGEGGLTWEYRADRETVVIRCTLYDDAGAFLPLFLHVKQGRRGRFVVEMESDQTDYRPEANPSHEWGIKRATMKGLRFWSRD